VAFFTNHTNLILTDCFYKTKESY